MKYQIRRFVGFIISFVVSFCIALAMFFGCSSSNIDSRYIGNDLKPNSERINIQERIVTVKCKIPEVECEFSGDNYVPTKKLIECISLLKEAIRVCNQ